MAEIYRKRLIPDECIHLKSDRILLQNDTRLLTSWDTLRPKSEFARGLSLYLIDKGWKISKIYDTANQFVYWYCDIIKTEYTKETDTYVFTDLLADVIIEPDKTVRVVDLDEFEPAFKKGLINVEDILTALGQLNGLLEVIYGGHFADYITQIEEYE